MYVLLRRGKLVSFSAYPVSGMTYMPDEEFKIRFGFLPMSSDPEPDPIALLQEENKRLNAQVQAQTERAEFIDDCIAELAIMVYGNV